MLMVVVVTVVMIMMMPAPRRKMNLFSSSVKADWLRATFLPRLSVLRSLSGLVRTQIVRLL